MLCVESKHVCQQLCWLADVWSHDSYLLVLLCTSVHSMTSHVHVPAWLLVCMAV
jgi:hypothetical protein